MSPRAPATDAGTSPWAARPRWGRSIAAAAGVAAISASAGPAIVSFLLPLIDVLLVIVARDFTVLSVGLIGDGRDTMVEARAVLRHAVTLGPLTVRPDARTGLAVATSLGTVLQPLLAASWLALAWPGSLPVVGRRLIVLVLLTPAALLLDATMYLLGSFWDLLATLHRQDLFLPVVAWMQVLGGGGRLALGLVGGALAIAWAARIGTTRTV